MRQQKPNLLLALMCSAMVVVLPMNASIGAEAPPYLERAARRITPSVVLVRTITQHAQPIPHEHTGSGTGVVMTRDGEILTNAHVVNGASTVEVLLPPFQFVTAKVIGINQEKEIARLQIVVPAGRSLIPAVWGDSQKLQIGQVVMKCGFAGAINSRRPSFAHGIVTNLRTFISRFSTPLIATDTQISSGDSGGPLLNIRGEIIGIDVAIAMDPANMTGVGGYAIPSHVAQRTWRKLAHGDARIGWLGFLSEQVVDLRALHGDRKLAAEVARFLAEHDVTPPITKQGFLIIGFFKKDRVGDGVLLKVGDVITHANGHVPQDPQELLQWVTEIEPDSTITLRVVRGGIPMLMRLRVGEFDSEKRSRAEAE